MGAFFVYIIKSAVCLVLFYLFYRLLLSKETFHRFNRIAILGILLLSLIIPLVEDTLHQPAQDSQTALTLEQLLMFANLAELQNDIHEQDTNGGIWIKILLIVYLCGILFFVCRNIYSLIHVIKLLRHNKRCKLENGVTLILHHKDNLSPFSWMKFIVLPEKDFEENGKEILTHETAHIENRHSIDLLLAEICIFFQWFNPAAWLLKQELQNIHEFEADETVINKGIDAKKYQLLLIKKAVGTRLYSMANSFNHSKLKKRITMMLKEKSSPWARLKYLYVLPVAAIAITAFARPEISNELKEISAVKVNDLATIATKIEEKNDTLRHVDDNLSRQTPALTADNSSLKIKVKQLTNSTETEAEQDVQKVNSDNELQTTVIEVIELGRKADAEIREGTFIAHEIASDIKTPQNPIKISATSTGTDEPLIIVDGKEVPNSVLSALNPDAIESISVLKDKSSVEQYGEKGKNGVILVTLKSNYNKASGFKKNGLPKDILVLLDGKEVDIESLDPSKVQSMDVITDPEMTKALTSTYGNKIKNGVIIVSYKDDKADKNQIMVYGGKTISTSGKVIDENGKPVVGAAVLVAGTTTGTITDLDGNYILKASEGAEIVISYIDMKTKKVKAGSEKITIRMERE